MQEEEQGTVASKYEDLAACVSSLSLSLLASVCVCALSERGDAAMEKLGLRVRETVLLRQELEGQHDALRESNNSQAGVLRALSFVGQQ